MNQLTKELKLKKNKTRYYLPFVFFLTIISSFWSFNLCDEDILVNDKLTYTSNKLPTLTQEGQLDNFYHLPITPSKSTSIPDQPKEREEEENKDNKECNNLHNSYLDPNNFSYKSIEVTFVHYEQNILKRPAISLVILNHCWKSFFS